MDDQLQQIADLKNKLEQTEAQYYALIEHAADGIYTMDPDYKFISVNTGICRMLGYTREELLKMKVKDFVDPEQLKNDPIKKDSTTLNKTIIKERTFIRKDKSLLEVEINVKMYDDYRSLVIARDISARKKMEEELREAEVKFRTIAERSMIGIYIIQNEYLVYVNPRFAEIFGYLPEEMIGTFPAINIFHNDYKETVKDTIQARLKGDIESVQYEAMCKRKDGSYIWVEFYGNGTIINKSPCIIGSMMEITDRKKAEEILRLSEANLQTILNTTDTSYILFDSNFRALAFNQMAALFIQTYHHHIPKIGDELMNYLPKKRYARFKEFAQKTLIGESIHYETSYKNSNGSIYKFVVRLFPLTDSGGKILGMVLAMDDITERKKDENKLKNAYTRIQKQLNCIKDMSWKQSHLMRSPLANLIGLVNMLEVSADETIILDYIKSELTRLDHIIIQMAGDADVLT